MSERTSHAAACAWSIRGQAQGTGPARAVGPMLWVLLVLGLAGAGAEVAHAQGPADWKRQEQRCIAACPKPSLRYQAGESAAQQRRRLAQEDRYNACYLRCTRDYVRHYPNLGKGQGGDSVKYYRNR